MTRALTTIRPRIAALAVAVLAVLAAPGAAAAAEPGLVTDLTWGISAADQNRTAAAIEDLGARWTRIEVNWSEVEPREGRYHEWSLDQIDRSIHLAQRAGTKVVVMIAKSPRWASGSGDPGTPPRQASDYARFVRFLAERYAGRGIKGYEIWNEQNIRRFWSTGVNAREYVELLRAANRAVNAGDPDAKVVFGGLSTNDYRFVERAYAAGAKGHFDVMAVHPYTCAVSPGAVRRDGGRISSSSFAGYREVRAAMKARGDIRPIWVTEFGWSTSSEECGVSETRQARFVTEAFEVFKRDPYVQAAMYYNLRNNYWDGDADHYEARFGLIRTDFSKKPAYRALKAAP